MEYKFSKNLGDITDIKKKFFAENEKLLKKSQNSNQFYNKQEIRKFCKVCQKSLAPYDFDFRNHGVEYKICRNCNHLNGLHEDSKEFTVYMYKGVSYSKNYMEDYDKRIEKVYLAKASLKSLTKILFEKNASEPPLSITAFPDFKHIAETSAVTLGLLS